MAHWFNWDSEVTKTSKLLWRRAASTFFAHLFWDQFVNFYENLNMISLKVFQLSRFFWRHYKPISVEKCSILENSLKTELLGKITNKNETTHIKWRSPELLSPIFKILIFWCVKLKMIFFSKKRAIKLKFLRMIKNQNMSQRNRHGLYT